MDAQFIVMLGGKGRVPLLQGTGQARLLVPLGMCSLRESIPGLVRCRVDVQVDFHVSVREPMSAAGRECIIQVSFALTRGGSANVPL